MCSIGYHVSQFNTSECVPISELLLYVTENRMQGLAPVTDHHRVQGLTPVTAHHSSLLVPTANIGQPTAIGYLAAENLVFWADAGVGEIWSMKR